MVKTIGLAVISLSMGMGALGLGGLVSTAGTPENAYQDNLTEISQDQYRDHSLTLFERADMDSSGSLDSDEYAALIIVQAELARLNGFVPLYLGDAVHAVSFGEVDEREPMTRGERTRIEMMARAQFHAGAGLDSALGQAEYSKIAMDVFLAADTDGDDVLNRTEMKALAGYEASLGLPTS